MVAIVRVTDRGYEHCHACRGRRFFKQGESEDYVWFRCVDCGRIATFSALAAIKMQSIRGDGKAGEGERLRGFEAEDEAK